MVGSWLDRRHDLDLYDLLPNPNKFDECDPDLGPVYMEVGDPNPPVHIISHFNFITFT